LTNKILIVDDEKDLVELLKFNLQKEGFDVFFAFDGQTALSVAERETLSLIVLDLMLPKFDGLEVCRRLKRNQVTAHIPIIMLTAKGEESDRVVGLELGADDYVVKPFSVRELIARVKAVLRRTEAQQKPKDILKVGDVVVDTVKHKVKVKGKELDLTLTEFRLLAALAQRRGQVLTRNQLIDFARGTDAFVVDRTMDVHLSSLRKKLGGYGDLIETVRGIGYRMKE
jgi:two-component system alkaline phosphatase synthesis response regulator PhoP